MRRLAVSLLLCSVATCSSSRPAGPDASGRDSSGESLVFPDGYRPPAERGVDRDLGTPPLATQPFGINMPS